jgi:hypothetical protein
MIGIFRSGFLSFVRAMIFGRNGLVKGAFY